MKVARRLVANAIMAALVTTPLHISSVSAFADDVIRLPSLSIPNLIPQLTPEQEAEQAAKRAAAKEAQAQNQKMYARHIISRCLY